MTIGSRAGISARFYNVAGSGGDPVCVLALGANSTTVRPLNAAGTIDVAEADFAEYAPTLLPPGAGDISRH